MVVPTFVYDKLLDGPSFLFDLFGSFIIVRFRTLFGSCLMWSCKFLLRAFCIFSRDFFTVFFLSFSEEAFFRFYLLAFFFAPLPLQFYRPLYLFPSDTWPVGALSPSNSIKKCCCLEICLLLKRPSSFKFRLSLTSVFSSDNVLFDRSYLLDPKTNSFMSRLL